MLAMLAETSRLRRKKKKIMSAKCPLAQLKGKEKKRGRKTNLKGRAGRIVFEKYDEWKTYIHIEI
jgi:hypothetical protein